MLTWWFLLTQVSLVKLKKTIRAKQVNAGSCLTEVTDIIAIFEGMEDNPYMQERAADRDACKRVLVNPESAGEIA